MMLLLALIASALLFRHAPRFLVDVIATVIGVTLVIRSRRLARRLIKAGDEHRTVLNFDCKPSRAERRLMRNSLRFALHQTELMSLLPRTTVRAATIAAWLDPKRGCSTNLASGSCQARRCNAATEEL